MALSIKLSSFSDFTAVNVEGLGVIKVKKESSNQASRRTEIIRDVFKLQDEGKALEKRIKKLQQSGVSEDDEEFIKLEKKGSTTLERIAELNKEEKDLRKSRLSDDEGGKLVDLLFNNATDEDIAKVLAVEVVKDEEDGEIS